jgi:mandelate racemase
VVGHAYLFAYTPLVLGPLVQLLSNLDTLLRGQPCVPHDIEQALGQRFVLLGNTGLVTMALSGIDMALWDLQARAAGLPLATLLGGSPRPVPAYFSQGMDGLERGVELAQECLARGFTAMKIKIGYASAAEDRAVVRAVQAELGPAATLAVDFNQSLNPAEALRRCRALDDLGLAWIEEPLRYDDDAGHAQLAAALDTPVMVGENWLGTHAMARSLAARACDMAMPDLMKIGGVSGWLRASALAHAARLPVGSHLFQEMSAHLMAVTPTAARLEWLDIAAPVLAQPLCIEAGRAIPNTSPGSGVAWDADAVRRYGVA